MQTKTRVNTVCGCGGWRAQPLICRYATRSTLTDGVALWNGLWRWCLFWSHGKKTVTQINRKEERATCGFISALTSQLSAHRGESRFQSFCVWGERFILQMSVLSKAYFRMKAYLALHVKWSNRLNTIRPENKSFKPSQWISDLLLQ